jgi:hypothetical protein
MDENYYRRRTTKRNLIIIIIIVAAIGVYVGVRIVRNAYYDICTQSYDRTPDGVVASYIQAITDRNGLVVQRCWDPTAYYELQSGCSQICLERILGTAYEIKAITPGQPEKTPSGRSNVQITVNIACRDSAEEHSAEILFDSVGYDLPWKHWKIIRSDFGGPISDPWCK